MSRVSSSIFNHLTHVQYFSLGMDADGNLGRLNSNDVFTPLANIPTVSSDLQALKDWRGSLNTKILVTFGGWVQSKYLDEVAASATARSILAQNVKDFLVANGIDGADIDWEGYDGPVDDTNYGLLLAELKSQFEGTNLELTVAVNATHFSLAEEFATNVDRINLMSYGRFYDGDTQVSLSRLQTWVNGWISAGAPANIIVAGVPAFGRTPSNAPAISYKDIISLYNPAITADTVTHNGEAYYFNGVETIKDKAAYVVNGGLNGIMIWDQGQDVDIFHSKSLLKAINEVIPINQLKSMGMKQLDNKQKPNSENRSPLVYPNPFSDDINVELSLKNSSMLNIELYDINGKMVKRLSDLSGDNITSYIRLNTTDLNDGIYILMVNADRNTYTYKMLKN